MYTNGILSGIAVSFGRASSGFLRKHELMRNQSPSFPCRLLDDALCSQDYRDLLRAQLGEAFPDLAEDVKLMTPAPPPSAAAAAISDPVGTSSAAGDTLHAGGPTMNGINSTHDVKMEDVR